MVLPGTPVSPVHEHKKITDEIDDLYMTTIFAAADISTFIVGGEGGSRKEKFLSFYRPFYGLYSHTKDLSQMAVKRDEGLEDLYAELNSWFEDSLRPAIRKGNYPDEFISDGLRLFDAYKHFILERGVVSVVR